jgi:hypothetical protein
VSRQLQSSQAEQWILDIRDNLEAHKSSLTHDSEQSLDYLSQQYEALYQLVRAVDGKLRFVGVPQPKTQPKSH